MTNDNEIRELSLHHTASPVTMVEWKTVGERALLVACGVVLHSVVTRCCLAPGGRFAATLAASRARASACALRIRAVVGRGQATGAVSPTSAVTAAESGGLESGTSGITFDNSSGSTSSSSSSSDDEGIVVESSDGIDRERLVRFMGEGVGLGRRHRPINDYATYEGPCKLVICVRTDIGMNVGKACAQCGHAAVSAFQQAVVHAPHVFGNWIEHGQTKVVLKVRSEQELYVAGLLAMLIECRAVMFMFLAGRGARCDIDWGLGCVGKRLLTRVKGLALSPVPFMMLVAPLWKQGRLQLLVLDLPRRKLLMQSRDR